MRYFITEEQRRKLHASAFFEFQKGVEGFDYQKYMNSSIFPTSGVWNEESLLLHMDIVDEIALYKYVPDFKYYSATIVDREKWNTILDNISEQTGKIREVFAELTPFAEESLDKSGYFLICGI